MLPDKRSVQATLALIILSLIVACASKPYLKVQYQLPPSSTALAGEAWYLEITDQRDKRAFLTTNAKNSLKDFNDTYSLVVLRDDGSGNLIGAYDLESLWRELFKQRLQNEGVTISGNKDNSTASLEVRIKTFKLDVADRKWILQMNYQAVLSINDKIGAQESVSGTAERLKVMGKSDAEKILGELVTDMVNKLDVEKLFQKAR